MATTQRDVARIADVSAMTVSRVINGDSRVTQTTRQRVERAAEELDYVPNELARGLSCRETRVLGAVIPDIANPYFAMVVRGAEQVAWRGGYRLILCNTRSEIEREAGHLEDMLALQVGGVLLAAAGDRSKDQIDKLTAHGVPVVLVDRSVRGHDGDIVEGENVEGARLLVEHLVGSGHTRIGMVNEAGDVSTARDRLEGYRRGLEGAGIPFVDELVIATSAIDRPRAREAALGLLDLLEPPTAIFAVNNVVGIGVADAARTRCLSIPGDLAVACFDDDGHLSRPSPEVTTMIQPAETFGATAARLLLDRIAGRAAEDPWTMSLPGRLVAGGSRSEGSAGRG